MSGASVLAHSPSPPLRLPETAMNRPSSRPAVTAAGPRPPITGALLRDAVLGRYIERRRRVAEEAAEDDPDLVVTRMRLGNPIDLALLARLARAIGDAHDPTSFATEGRIVAFRTPSRLDHAAAKTFAREVVPVLASLLDVAAPQAEAVFAHGWKETDGSNRAQAEENVARVLGQGRLVVLGCDELDRLDGSPLEELIDVELVLPPLSSEDVVAMLAAVQRPGWDDPDLLAALPPAAQLGDVSSLHLTHAWAADDDAGAIEVARRLARAAERAAAAAKRAGEEDEAAAQDDPVRDVPGLRLADLHGLGPAGALLRRLVADVADWQGGHLDWSDVGAAILLSGPPGCGKTSAAAAVAGEIDGPVIDMTYTKMQAAGHQGHALRALDDAVDLARKSAPCVALIDEVDDLADRGGYGGTANSHNARYMRTMVNAYLTRLTELADVPGVVVVLATNHPHLVDSALIRAGRVDHHLRIGLPDRDALGTILVDALGAHAAPGLTDTSAWSDALDALTGGSGADAAKLARDAIAAARSRARRQRAGRPTGHPTGLAVTSDDLAAAVSALRADGTIPPDLRRLAIHEAGHIVVAHALGRPRPSRAWIGPQGAGVTAPVERTYMADTARAELACLLAGMEAERLVLGGVSTGAGAGGQDSDLAKATTMAARIASEWHLETTDNPPVWRSAESHAATPDWAHRRTTEMVEQLLTDARGHCADLLNEQRADVARVANALLAERELDGDAIARLLDGRTRSAGPGPGPWDVPAPTRPSPADGGPR